MKDPSVRSIRQNVQSRARPFILRSKLLRFPRMPEETPVAEEEPVDELPEDDEMLTMEEESAEDVSDDAEDEILLDDEDIDTTEE